MPVPQPAALHHTCFLVPDVVPAARALSKSLGIGPWNVWTIEPAASSVRGVPAPFTFRAALAAVGGSHYELVAPVSGRSVFDEFLERRGAGCHHTCLFYPTIEAVREAKAALVAEGRELIQEASTGDVFDFGYFQFPEIGSAVEVLFLDPSKLPPPELVI